MATNHCTTHGDETGGKRTKHQRNADSKSEGNGTCSIVGTITIHQQPIDTDFRQKSTSKVNDRAGHEHARPVARVGHIRAPPAHPPVARADVGNAGVLLDQKPSGEDADSEANNGGQNIGEIDVDERLDEQTIPSESGVGAAPCFQAQAEVENSEVEENENSESNFMRIQEVTENEGVENKKKKDDNDEDNDQLSSIIPVLDGRYIKDEQNHCHVGHVSQRTLVHVYKVTVETQRDYEKFHRRLITFDHYEGDVMPRLQLAKAGFIRPTSDHLEMQKQINKQQQPHDAEEELDEEDELYCKDAILCIWCGLLIHKFCTRVDGIALHQLHNLRACTYLQDILKNEQQNPGLHLSSYDYGVKSTPQTIPNLAEDSLSLLTTSTQAAQADIDTADLERKSEEDAYQTFAQPRIEQDVTVVKSISYGKLPYSMTYEERRLNTFNDCPIISKSAARALAANGLYWKGGRLFCAFCSRTFSVSTEDILTSAEEIISKHKKSQNMNSCMLSKGANIPLVLEEDCWGREGDNARDSESARLENLGVVTELSKHPEFAIETRRKATFVTYPYGGTKGSAELVEAGYFYCGNGDAVTCFSCGIESANWKMEETPWQRHARSSKNCQFVVITKGVDFVNQMIEQFQEYFTPEPENKINNVTTRMLRPRMDSPSVQGCLATVKGIEKNGIRTAVSNRIMKGKPDFVRIADIVREVTELRAPNPPYSQKLILPRHSKPTTVESEEQTSSAAIQREAGVEAAAASLGAASSAKDDKSMEVEDAEPERRDVLHSMDSLSTSLTTDSSRSEPPSRVDPLAALKNVESYRVITSQLTCKICLSAVVGIIFLPCGHLVCCTECAAAMQQCPLCRQDIRGTVKDNFDHLGSNIHVYP